MKVDSLATAHHFLAKNLVLLAQRGLPLPIIAQPAVEDIICSFGLTRLKSVTGNWVGIYSPEIGDKVQQLVERVAAFLGGGCMSHISVERIRIFREGGRELHHQHELTAEDNKLLVHHYLSGGGTPMQVRTHRPARLSLQQAPQQPMQLPLQQPEQQPAP